MPEHLFSRSLPSLPHAICSSIARSSCLIFLDESHYVNSYMANCLIRATHPRSSTRRSRTSSRSRAGTPSGSPPRRNSNNPNALSLNTSNLLHPDAQEVYIFLVEKHGSDVDRQRIVLIEEIANVTRQP